jgi:GT2 family glycosyltransferase
MEEEEQIAACTPKILDYHKRTHFEYAGAAGGYLDRYGYPFCRGRIFDTLEEDSGQYDDDVEIFWGSGACLLVRSELFKQAGGLDETFFAHMEEIDLCWRLKRLGYRIEFVARSRVYHVGGGTLPKGNPMKTFLNFRNNLLLLYKNLPKKGRSLTILMRMILDGISAFRFLFQGAFADFRAVIRAHVAFYRLRIQYRDQNNKEGSDVNIGQIYPHSIVLDYFFKGRKHFEQIQHRF